MPNSHTSPHSTPDGVIRSRANPRVKQLRAALAGNSRLADSLVAIEGEHLVAEAVRSGLPLTTLFLVEGRSPPDWLPAAMEVLELAPDVFDSVAGTRTPQGIAALLAPPVHPFAAMLRSPALILIAAGLQDPGNLGTLIRSAEAFSATGLLTAPGTVSPWNDKAMRASAGSVFRLPLHPATPANLATLRSHNVRLLAAVKQDAEPIHAVDLTLPCALLIGNEGSGLSPEWLALADRLVTIPCPGPVESLNAAIAGTLLLYEASRQRETLAPPGESR